MGRSCSWSIPGQFLWPVMNRERERQRQRQRDRETERDLVCGEFQFHFETSSHSAVFLTVTFVLRSPPALSRPSTLSLLQQRILSTTPAFFVSSSCCLPSTISMYKNSFDRQGTVAFDRQENNKSRTLIPSSEFWNRGQDVQVYLT